MENPGGLHSTCKWSEGRPYLDNHCSFTYNWIMLCGEVEAGFSPVNP